MRKTGSKDFPGGPVVKTLPSNVGYSDLIPGQEIKVLHNMGCGQNLKTSKNKGRCWLCPMTWAHYTGDMHHSVYRGIQRQADPSHSQKCTDRECSN